MVGTNPSALPQVRMLLVVQDGKDPLAYGLPQLRWFNVTRLEPPISLPPTGVSRFNLPPLQIQQHERLCIDAAQPAIVRAGIAAKGSIAVHFQQVFVEGDDGIRVIFFVALQVVGSGSGIPYSAHVLLGCHTDFVFIIADAKGVVLVVLHKFPVEIPRHLIASTVFQVQVKFKNIFGAKTGPGAMVEMGLANCASSEQDGEKNGGKDCLHGG
jgi:hypothetical protein